MKTFWVITISLIVVSCGIILAFLQPPEDLRFNWDNIIIDSSLVSSFPKSFLWGTATSSHQVEGNCNNNNWARWENIPGKILNGDKAGLACDHWNKYKEDIQLMKQLGVNTYRFSIEWSKIQPRMNEYSQEAIDHYEQVIDELIAQGIQPMITLHHFTNPLWFEDIGQFEIESNIQYFVNFSEFIFKKFSKKVTYWCVINESEVVAIVGHLFGFFPPGRHNIFQTFQVMKNLIKAHTQVYNRLKALPGGEKVMIGFVKNVMQFDPYNYWNPVERIVCGFLDYLWNGFMLNKLKVEKPLDFIGLNYYSHVNLKFQFTPPFINVAIPPEEQHLKTTMNYTVYAEGFYRALKLVSELNVPIIVTENGIADPSDTLRDIYLRRYLYSLKKAIEENIDVRGYIFWSLMDNFEWMEGYSQKFGLYEVNFNDANLTRTLRKSAKFFVDIVNKFNTLKKE